MTMSSGETSITFIAVDQEFINGVENPLSELDQQMQEFETPKEAEALLPMTKNALQEAYDAASKDAFNAVLRNVKTSYPEAHLADKDVPSARSLAGNDGSMRRHIKDEQDKLKDDSKRELVAALSSEWQQFNHSPVHKAVDDDTILEHLNASIEMSRQSVTDILSQLDSPDDLRRVATAQQISRVIGMKLPDYIHKDPAYRETVNTIAKLKQALASARNDTAIIDRVVEELLPTITALAQEEVSAFTNNIVQNATNTLVQKLRTGHNSATPDYVAKKDTERTNQNQPATPTHHPNKTSTVETTPLLAEKQFRLSPDFAWLEKGQVVDCTLKVIEGSPVVTTRALSSYHDGISQHLRQELAVREILDSAEYMTIRLIASGNDLQHANVKRLSRSISAAYDGLIVCRYGGIRPNAPRTYFAKTSVEQQPAFQEHFAQLGIPEQTPIVIILAETDKNNQIDTLVGFGIDRRGAVSWGAGS